MSRQRPHLSFQAKVIIPMVAILAVLSALTVWVIDRRISDQFETEAAGTLQAADAVFRKSQEIRAKSLLLAYRNAPNDPSVKAVARTGDRLTWIKRLNELTGELDAEMILFTAANGKRLAGVTRNPHLSLGQLETGAASSVRKALNGEPNVDIAYTSQRLFDVASIPVMDNGYFVGVLTFATEISESVVKDFGQLTHSEIIFLANRQVVAASLQKPTLYRSLAHLEHDMAIAAEKSNQPAHESIKKIVFSNEHFLCQRGDITASRGIGAPAYLLLVSYEQPLLVLQATQRMLLLAMLSGILLGSLLLVAVIRKLTQPLRQLRDSAEAVGRGDFSQRVEVRSYDELGELALVFNQMTENLKTSRAQLEKTVETLKTTQAQLVQREKLSAIGEFVAGVAHELNNPLTSVIGFAQLVQQSVKDQQHHRFLERVVGEAQRCAKIVQSLLSFARQHAPERKLVDLNERVDAAVDILRYQLRTSGIEVITKLDSRLPGAMADPHQLQQVFVNIINNARQAIEAHRRDGRLRISTETSSGRVRVLFQDNGPGIDEKNIAKIFDPFFTTKEVGKGTGLGLSLSYGIIQEHGGNIFARSKSGEGATFIIELPIATEAIVAQSKEAAAPAPAPVAVEGNGKKLLVVDDEASILELTREVLTEDHYRVDTARDGQSALRKLHQNRYDLIVCDLKMPDLSGEQVYHRLRDSNPGAAARVIFMTGDVVNEKTQQFFESYGRICLPKPFTLEEFRSAVGKVFQNAEPVAS